MIDYDALELAGMCDCGRPLRGHQPLPRPKPLVSWKAAKETNPNIFIRKPNPAMIESHERYGRLRMGMTPIPFGARDPGNGRHRE